MQLIEAALQRFLSVLFDFEIDPGLRHLCSVPVKHDGLGIPNPVEQAEVAFSRSIDSCKVLVNSLLD